ncbi:MAG: EamA family transporter [Holophaga sp.]|nr:EamA family transporter [Holophaga sp.]
MNKKVYSIGALLIVYFLWGGTYLGIRFAVQTIPPFLMAGTRFLVAGLAVYLYSRCTGAARPGKAHWIDAILVGALLLLAGNGLVSWAEQMVSSSVAALLIATVPLWMILMGLLGKHGTRPKPVVAGAIVLGFAGIAILVLPSGSGLGRISPVGVIALLAGAFFWAWGSLYSRQARLPGSPLLAVGMQMLAGGALLVLASGLCGEWGRFRLAEVSLRSMFGMGYLVLFGSIIAYNAYIWLLKNADPTWVSTYAFVNPVVAVFLGWLLAHEQLTARSVWATVVIILSVVIITVSKNLEAAAARRA